VVGGGFLPFRLTIYHAELFCQYHCGSFHIPFHQYSGSTAALTTIEYESGVIHDLKKAIERMAPEDMYYEHNERWRDGNGYSHVRSALIGPSLHIPLIDGKLTLGTWQQIVLLDFDNRPRQRQVIVQMSGE
jgi:secondary thiamine-phosphate synthase enzyme